MALSFKGERERRRSNFTHIIDCQEQMEAGEQIY
jgi:hypothetical protein